jgi:hypothetical protein
MIYVLTVRATAPRTLQLEHMFARIRCEMFGYYLSQYPMPEDWHGCFD